MQTLVFPEQEGQLDEAWDFVDDEDLLLSFAPSPPTPAEKRQTSLARLHPALGPTPSVEEAADATRLLRHSLQQFEEASCADVQVPPQGGYFRVLEPTSATSSSSPGATSAVIPSSQGDFAASNAALVAAARANAASRRSVLVTQALELFTSNESVQHAVRSLACDPSVWRAVSNNPEVRRLITGPSLLHSDAGNRTAAAPHPNTVRELTSATSTGNTTLALKLQHLLQGVLQRLSDLKASFIGGLSHLLGFSSVDAEGEEGSEGERNASVVPGLVTVLVLVVAIIVLKRPILV